MSYEAERDAIESFFGIVWGTRTPVGYDGRSFDPVHESVQIDILNAQAMQMSMGSPGDNVARYPGVVAIRVYTTAGKRDSSHVSRKLEDAICDIFRNQRVGNLIFRVPYVSGTENVAPWRVRTVMVPFQRDEFHA